MKSELLFNPCSIGNVALSNRIVMAPMTRSKSPHHIPTLEAADYYRSRAEGGVGLIITEGTAINHPAAHAYPDVPNFYGEQALAGWKRVVDEVHAAGGKIFPQLWHVGSVRQRTTHANQGVDNPRHCCHCNHPEVPGYGPSSIPHPFVQQGETPQELTQRDIDEIINAYVEGAKSAKEIGFDGVELHAAHGYLIDQFFWSATNKRQDKYGGNSLAARSQFAIELIQSVRDAVGADFPISFRISQWKLGDYTAKMASSPEELSDFVCGLAEAGVDIFHCSTRRFYEPEFEHSPLTFAGWVKKLSGKPSIAVGSIGLDNDFVRTYMGEETNIANYTLEKLYDRLERNEFDLAAVGRMLLANPDWANKIKNQKLEEIVPFSQKQHAGMKK